MEKQRINKSSQEVALKWWCLAYFIVAEFAMRTLFLGLFSKSKAKVKGILACCPWPPLRQAHRRGTGLDALQTHMSCLDGLHWLRIVAYPFTAAACFIRRWAPISRNWCYRHRNGDCRVFATIDAHSAESKIAGPMVYRDFTVAEFDLCPIWNRCQRSFYSAPRPADDCRNLGQTHQVQHILCRPHLCTDSLDESGAGDPVSRRRTTRAYSSDFPHSHCSHVPWICWVHAVFSQTSEAGGVYIECLYMFK